MDDFENYISLTIIFINYVNRFHILFTRTIAGLIIELTILKRYLPFTVVSFTQD